MASDKDVYIVDDDAASAASLQALMLTEGLSTAAYSSAEEFLAAYDGIGGGCLVLDIRLEGMSGLDLQQVLLSRGAPLSIVMITGHGDETIRGEAKSNGAIAVLEKPFSASELCKSVRASLSTRDEYCGG